MRKTGKKFLLLALALVVALSVFVGCNGNGNFKPLDGVPSGDVVSNGGFVAQKGEWIYFVNGVESNTSENKYGNVRKGSLVRISENALNEKKFDGAQVVIPEIVYDGSYKGGVFISGDYVYYATPNNTKNMQAQVENNWLNFKRARLDGSDVLSGHYAQLEIGKHEYRFVEENGVVYLLYANTSDKELHSVNTQTKKDTTLAKGYAEYAFDADDLTSSTVYYTMPVAKKNTYSNGSATNEAYQQLFKVQASTTQAPREYDLKDGYTDPKLSEGDEKYMMEYVNLGTLVLDGVGADKTEATTFNPDWKDGDAKKQTGFSYAIERFSNGDLYFTVTALSGDTANPVAYVCRLNDGKFSEAQGWNTILANPVIEKSGNIESSASEAITLVSNDEAKATETARFYVQDGKQYFVYLDSTSNNIYRRSLTVSSDKVTEEDVLLASGQSGAAFLRLDTESKFLYFSKAGTNGNALWRIRYDGTREQYSDLGDVKDDPAMEDYKATQYVGVDYSKDWFAPEVLGGRIFFADAETYAENYVYVIDACANNADLKARNEQYQKVQDLFTNVAEKFSAASNVMKYYYYGGDVSVVTAENGEYRKEYDDEAIALINAFVSGENSNGFDFASVKDIKTQSVYYNRIGVVSEKDRDATEKSLKTAFVLGFKAETETVDAGWTWQWAAIFVPVGVVVIGGAVAAFVFVRKRRI